MSTSSTATVTRVPISLPQRFISLILIASLLVGSYLLQREYGWQQGALLLVGVLLGFTLIGARFGFASAYRKLIVNRQIDGILAQIVMLLVATWLFAPTLAAGEFGGLALSGATAKLGPVLFLGALLFGIGMQLGGACGCGTLAAVGGGNLTLLITLFTFSIGAFTASITRHLWKAIPDVTPIVLLDNYGTTGAVLIQSLFLIALAGLFIGWRIFGQKKQTNGELPQARTLFSGTDSQVRLLFIGAVVLAVLNWVTLLLSGMPWRITWTFALLPAKIAAALGWDSTSAPFWAGEGAQAMLADRIFADVCTVMNIGLVGGAVLAVAITTRWQPEGTWKPVTLVAHVIGGLLMGYGALLAAGCNVGAYFSGIASTSLHGWLWIVAALIGSAIGVKLRPLFGLEN
jgi:uncharacterized membrane protein YedE/YeeE